MITETNEKRKEGVYQELVNKKQDAKIPPADINKSISPASNDFQKHEVRPKARTGTSLSKEVAQLVESKDYKAAHRKLAQESLQGIKGKNITEARWKRFPYKDEKIGYVPLPKNTALKIDGSFIPANKVNLSNDEYIAIQAPQTNFGGDIWQAAIDSKTSIICDLTGESDKLGIGKGGPIEEYYPNKKNKEIIFDNGVKVIFKGQFQGNGYTKSKYNVIDTNGETREIRRYNYTEWPDHGVPAMFP